MYEYFCIRFIDSMSKSKNFINYSNPFSPKEYLKNDKTVNFFFFFEKILKRLGCEKSIVLNVKNIKILNSIRYHIFVIKHYLFLVFVIDLEMKIKKYLRKKS